AVVVVDEVGVTVVDPLVIGHVGVGRVDADGLRDDLVKRPAGADQPIIDVAGADLVPRQDTLFEIGVEGGDLAAYDDELYMRVIPPLLLAIATTSRGEDQRRRCAPSR